MTTQEQLEELRREVSALRAERAVRLLTMRYFKICDDLGASTSLEALGAVFARDAVWEGRGRYRKAFGRHEGRDAIVAMLATYTDPPHFVLNGHYLTSETISVVDAERASGQWMMLQISTYRDGRSDFRSASLTINFRYEDDSWRISRFATDNIFARDVARWNDEASISIPHSHAEERV